MNNKPIYVTQSSLPPLKEYTKLLEEIWESGILTHNGPKVIQLEHELKNKLGTDHLSVFSNGTIAIQIAIRALELQGAKEWEKYAKSDKLPNDIPAAPWNTYKKEWDGSGDWLGNGHISNTEKSKNYISWPQAKIEYKKLSEKYGLRNQKDWRNFSKTHAKQIEKLNIPANPRVVYTKEKIWGKMK